MRLPTLGNRTGIKRTNDFRFTGLEDGTLVKVGVPLGDLNSGLYGSYGILSAYINLLRTGKGQFVDTSLLDASIAYTFWQAAVYFSTSEIPRPLGTKHPLTAPYQVFTTKDDHIVIGGASQRAWELLCVALNSSKLIDDKRFNTSKRRKQNETILAKILQDVFSKKTTDVWIKILEKNESSLFRKLRDFNNNKKRKCVFGYVYSGPFA